MTRCVYLVLLSYLSYDVCRTGIVWPAIGTIAAKARVTMRTALSGDARRRTSLPDGRDFATAGDDYGIAVQDCEVNR